MQVVQNCLIRLQAARLTIGDRACLAEGFDDVLCFSQVVAGHTWEQMMLDLIV